MNPHNERLSNIAKAIEENISQVIIGKQNVVEYLLISLIASGHVLIEDVPGIGKTTLVSALAKSLSLSFKRIQFTTDLMPSDITGFNLYHPRDQEFVFQEGAVMANLVLADEINRSSPKTQSALLEVMQENQVTVDGKTYPMEEPFMVLATQNAIEYLGTFPLPEAQLDRFLMRIHLGYPNTEEEMLVLDLDSQDIIDNKLTQVADKTDVLWLRSQLKDVYCQPEIKEYIVSLLQATRNHPSLSLGASPRAGQMLLRGAKAKALLKGRDYVTVDDVKSLVVVVLAHRLSLDAKVQSQDITTDTVLVQILESLKAPK